ncbi:MAG: hypothetical protein HY816_19985 [Candidatus Wallbacteria bacterium]|nr:hypothetical protein [Candidatus Wallbacteria bacterium]
MSRFVNGNNVQLRIDGKVVGEGVTAVNANDDFGATELYGLGSADPIEIQDTQHRYSVTLASYFMPDDKLSDAGFASVSEVIATGRMEILVLHETGIALEHYIGCKRASKGRGYNANQPSNENVTFKALRKIEDAALAAAQ